MRRLWLDILILILLCATAPLWLALAYTGQRSVAFDADPLSAMLPSSGLHDLEQLSDRPGTFRWTNGAAQLYPPNPGGPILLRLSLATGLEQQTPVILHTDTLRQSFTVIPGLRRYHLLLPAHSTERLTISIESPTHAIARRTLGIVYHQMLLDGGGAVPGRLNLVFIVATLSLYLLLRRADVAPWMAFGLTLVLQMLLAGWQSAGLWRYAMLTPLLLAASGAALAALLIERLWPLLPAPSLPQRQLSAMPRRPLILLLLLAVAVCLPWLNAPDPVGDLELVSRRMGFMYEFGGLSQAFTYGGDLMPFWLYTLRFLGPFVDLLGGTFYDPVSSITHTLIKVPSILALLATVALLYWWGYQQTGPRRALLIAGLYLIIPPVWMNAAWWGQVDVLISLPMLMTLVFFDDGRGRWSWILWAVAVMIKVHAIILAPLLYVLTLRRYGPRGLLEGAALASGVIALFCLPFVLAGEGPGLYQAIAGSVGRFPLATHRAYNLWWIVVDGQNVLDLVQVAGLTYRSIGFILIGLVTALACLALLRQPGRASRAAVAAMLALAFFTLPTQIHERYSFFAMPLLLLCAATDLRALIPFALITLTATINLFGAIPAFSPPLAQWIVTTGLTTFAAWLNLATLFGLLIFMWLDRREAPDTTSSSSA
ncbi:glycosyltransferase 87 family protein [Candidatus Oscillochloris fontis]|uniref:glycosyltransferase 87 family protein n=1 Tax=Candidatus Oscillochloris fontis TaxID=2496868 RepID=UPI00101DF32D|nr:glycosyltransferase 87 family protein [Candidatus Oscillochloris fontis]